MSEDGADKRRKRRSLRVPVDEVPRPTAPPEEPVDPQPMEAGGAGARTVETPALSPEQLAAALNPQAGNNNAQRHRRGDFDGTATVEMPAFTDDDGLVASWITPSSGTPRSTVASPPPTEAEPASSEALQSVEVELDSGLQALEDDGVSTAVGTESPGSADLDSASMDSAGMGSASMGELDGDVAPAAPESEEVSLEATASDESSEDDFDSDDADSVEADSVEADSVEAAPVEAAPVVAQVVVQRVVSVAVGEPTPTPPEQQEPEPEFEEPDIIVDDNYDGDDLDSAELDRAELDSAELDSAELDSAELDRAELDSAELDRAELDRAELDSAELDSAELDSAELDSAELDSAELDSEEVAGDEFEDSLHSDEVELDEPVSQEILVDHDDDDPILTSDEDDDEPSLETSEISEEELAEELPEEEGDIEELEALELDDAAAEGQEASPPVAPPAPPDKPPPPPPKSAKPAAPPPAADKAAPRRKKARKKWFEELFNDDYLRTVPVPHPKTIVRQCDFIEQRFGLAPGATILDVGCGLGLHAVELTRRGYLVVGLDLSLPMLSRAADEAQSEGFKINFLHADMREMNFEGAFDAVLCWNTTLGYFDDETNKQIIERLYKALKPRGLLLLDVVNRDYVIQGQPNLVWFEGDGAVVMEETKMNYITSRLEVKRTVILDNGRQRDSLYSLRLYSVHELGQLLHHKGFRVVELTGREAHPGVFFGAASPRLIILAERRASIPARPSVQPPRAGESTPPPPKPPEAEGNEPAPTE